MNKIYEIWSGKIGFWLTMFSIVGVIIVFVEREMRWGKIEGKLNRHLIEDSCFTEKCEKFMYLQNGINQRHEVLFMIDLTNSTNASISIDSPTGDSGP